MVTSVSSQHNQVKSFYLSDVLYMHDIKLVLVRAHSAAEK